MNEAVTGLILAGGRSRRMGTDKGLVVYQGLALVEHAIQILRPVCTEIIISSSNPLYGDFGFCLVSDRFHNAGPGAGIEAGLAVAKSPLLAVLSVDTPKVSTALYVSLIQRFAGKMAVVPRHSDGYLEPLCALYHISAYPVIAQSLRAGVFKMSDILSRLEVTWVEIFGNEKNQFYNINTRDDLDQ